MKLSELKQLVRMLKQAGYKRYRRDKHWFKQWDRPNNWHHYRVRVGIWEIIRFGLGSPEWLQGWITMADRHAEYEIKKMIRMGGL